MTNTTNTTPGCQMYKKQNFNDLFLDVSIQTEQLLCRSLPEVQYLSFLFGNSQDFYYVNEIHMNLINIGICFCCAPAYLSIRET